MASFTCSELLAQAIGTPNPGDLNFTSLQQLLVAILRKLNLENVPYDQIESLALESESASVLQNPPIEQNEPRTEQEILLSPQEDTVSESTEEASQCGQTTVICFEESEAHRETLSKLSQLEDSVNDLKTQLLEQGQISKAILPTVEELDEFCNARKSSICADREGSLDYLTLAARLDKIDESIGKLASMANDTVLEYSRLEKSILPCLDGGELSIMRAQLDNVNQLLKANFPGYRAHCSSVSMLRTSRASDMDGVVPTDFYQHPIPSTVKSLVSRRSTIRHQPMPDLEKELDSIKAVLSSLITRLPLPELETSTDLSTPESSSSVELAVESIRSIWPREFEELLRSSHERIDALEIALEEHRNRLDGVASDCDALGEIAENLKVLLENSRETALENVRELEHELGDRLKELDRRFDVEQMETGARLDELEQQMEMVNYEHYRTRLLRDTFTKTIEQLQAQIDARGKYFSNELENMVTLLNTIGTGLEIKSDKDELERLETRLRRRLTYMHVMITNIRGALRATIEAAGTKVRSEPEALRCISCNHEATMRALDELIPTGKSLQVAEKQHEKRLKHLQRLALRIATADVGQHSSVPPKQEVGSTKKANMEQPSILEYNIHANDKSP